MNKYLILILLPFTSTLMAAQPYGNLAALQADLQNKVRASGWNDRACSDNRPGGWQGRGYGLGYVSSMVLAGSNYITVAQTYLDANKVVTKTPYSPASSRTDVTHDGTLTLTVDTTSFKNKDITNTLSTSFGVQASYGVNSTFVSGSYETVSTAGRSFTTGTSTTVGDTWTFSGNYPASAYRGGRSNLFWINRYRLDKEAELVVDYQVAYLTYTVKCNYLEQGKNRSRVVPFNIVLKGAGPFAGAYGASNRNTNTAGTWGMSLGLSTDTFGVKTMVDYQLDYQDHWPVRTQVYDSGRVYYSGQSEAFVRAKYGLGSVTLYPDSPTPDSWFTKP